jgi:Gpi18-like mannosyltransferase
VLISSLSFLVGVVYLIKLSGLDYPINVSKLTFMIILFFPTSFIFSSVYTEGLFFMLMILSFYSARKNNWLLAGIFGGLAGYTRFVGIFLFPALLIECIFQARSAGLGIKPFIKKVLPLGLIILGLGIYMFFLFKTTGDPLAFYHVQTEFFQSRSQRIIMPYQVVWRYIKMIFTVSHNDFLYLSIWLEFLTGITFMILSVISLFKQRLSYAVFSISACLLPTLTGNFVSLPRYVLICFPLFILLADLLASHRKIRLIYFTLSGLGLFVFLSLFARGYWVT